MGYILLWLAITLALWLAHLRSERTLSYRGAASPPQARRVPVPLRRPTQATRKGTGRTASVADSIAVESSVAGDSLERA